MQTPKLSLPMEGKTHSKAYKLFGFLFTAVGFFAMLAATGGVISLIVWPLVSGVLKPYGLKWTFWQSAHATGLILLFAVITAAVGASIKETKQNGHRRFPN